MQFKLNGQERVFDGDPDLSLLNYLREIEGITSPKDGCAPQAACGCCVVQVNDKALLACVTPMKKVEGGSVITVEALDDDTKLVVRFASAGLKTLRAKYARLEPA